MCDDGFISSVSIGPGKYVGLSARTKKEAEMNAAQMTLEHMYPNMKLNFVKGKEEEEILNIEFIHGVSHIIHLFIDGENVPTFAEELKGYLDYVKYDVFISVSHPLYLKRNEHYHTIDTGVRDAADTLMSFYLGSYLSSHKDEVYVILTKDHFGASLARIIEIEGSKSYHIKWCSDVKELIKKYLSV